MSAQIVRSSDLNLRIEIIIDNDFQHWSLRSRPAGMVAFVAELSDDDIRSLMSSCLRMLRGRSDTTDTEGGTHE